MGMYTRLVLNVALSNESDIVSVVYRMVKGEATELPGRLAWMLTSSSHYHDAIQHSSIEYDKISNCHKLSVTCDFKNYEDEVSKFLEMIAPHVETYRCAGYFLYEEDESPTLIWFRNKKPLLFTPDIPAELQKEINVYE